jgi:hypothetical protein
MRIKQNKENKKIGNAVAAAICILSTLLSYTYAPPGEYKPDEKIYTSI